LRFFGCAAGFVAADASFAAVGATAPHATSTDFCTPSRRVRMSCATVDWGLAPISA